jgi:hypothetical protein
VCFHRFIKAMLERAARSCRCGFIGRSLIPSSSGGGSTIGSDGRLSGPLMAWFGQFKLTNI